VHSRLKEERVRLGMTQGAFAEIAGVSKRTVANYEAGERSPDADFLTAISSTGVDVLYVLTGQRNSRLPMPAPTMAPDEQAVLEMYRNASPKGKAAIKAVGLAVRAIPPIEWKSGMQEQVA